MSLKFIANPKRTNFRVAVVVSRKVSKSAVVRNRIRRRIYTAIEPIAKELPASYDLILNVYSSDLADMPYTSLVSLLTHLFNQAGIK